MKRKVSVIALFGLLAAGCGRQPCPEVGERGPHVKLDVALGQCNHAPEAVISGPTAVGKGQDILLDASSSVDRNGEPLSYRWRLMDAPVGSAASLTGPDGVQVVLRPDLQGEYTFELVVDDGDLSSRPAEHTVRVENRAPVADAGLDVSGPLDQPITLDGSGSADPDGDPLSYSWSIVQQPTGSVAALAFRDTAQPVLTPDVVGLYRVRLVVNDGDRASEPDEVQVAGGVTGGPPVASAGPDVSGNVGQPILLDGSASADPDGDALTYSWRIVSMPQGAQPELRTPDQAQARLVPDVQGSYTVELTVSDGVFMAADTAEVDARPQSGPSTFDPSEVYIEGWVGEPLRGGGAIAHWSTPTRYSIGTSNYQQRVLPDGRLVQTVSDTELRIFNPDAWERGVDGNRDYPHAPESNDPDFRGSITCPTIVPGALIVDRLGAWVLCETVGTDEWQHTDGRSFMNNPYSAILAIQGDTYLQDNPGIVKSSTSAAVYPIAGLNGVGAVKTARLVDDDYWVVFEPLNTGGQDSLWRITQFGQATKEGDFPPPPIANSLSVRAALDGRGQLFEVTSTSPDVHDFALIRRSTGGTAEVLRMHTEGPDTIGVFGIRFVTGP